MNAYLEESFFFCVSLSPYAGWAGTRAQSGDWNGSGMLLPGQSLRGRLPLLSHAFRHSNLRHQVPPRLHDARDPSSEGWNYGREYCPVSLAEMTTSTFTCRKLRHDTEGFTSPSKEDVLRTFFALKIRRFLPGLNPRTRVPEASTLIPRPSKTLVSPICYNI